MVGTVSKYAGQPLATGAQAEVYANDFIAVHLARDRWRQDLRSAECRGHGPAQGSPAYTAAEAKVQTVFQGTTLRGLLLEAYAFGTFATIALIAGDLGLRPGRMMALLVAFGFWHARRTDDAKELAVHHTDVKVERLVTA